PGWHAQRALPARQVNDREGDAAADQQPANLAIDLKENARRIGRLLRHGLGLFEKGVLDFQRGERLPQRMPVEVVPLAAAALDRQHRHVDDVKLAVRRVVAGQSANKAGVDAENDHGFRPKIAEAYRDRSRTSAHGSGLASGWTGRWSITGSPCGFKKRTG